MMQMYAGICIGFVWGFALLGLLWVRSLSPKMGGYQPLPGKLGSPPTGGSAVQKPPNLGGGGTPS